MRVPRGPRTQTPPLSVDGASAYDMMRGLLDMEGGESVLLFVGQFYCRVSQNLWSTMQGEGGEQGDPLMPMLYSLGQRTGGHRQKSPSHGDSDGILG